MEAGPANLFDLNALGRLQQGAAGEPSPASLREAAQEFESLFIRMMLKSMRQASFGDDIFGGYRNEFYRDLFDQQIALEMSRGEGIGLADVILRQLSVDRAPPAPSVSMPPAAAPGPVAIATDRHDFVARLWPYAVDAARSLGVSPRAVLAQAALETGWGSRSIAADAGRSANNLFGIKAGRSWDGDVVRVATVEYEGPVAARRREAFRVYDSLASGIGDYVKLLSENPRYRDALDRGEDIGGFARALQRGGYATDPKYADKLTAIAEGAELDQALARLKLSAQMPKP